MSKQNHKTLVWILAFLFAMTNVVSIVLPFVSARDVLEPAHYMVFRTINITELSIASAGRLVFLKFVREPFQQFFLSHGRINHKAIFSIVITVLI